jgi:YD repeat-containing protein
MLCKMTNPRLSFLLTALCIGLLTTSYSQTLIALPPSSQSINSGKMLDEHMVNFSGVVPINIPIYTFNSGKLSHSIALTYQSDGNRVEDQAGWVGLGFSLNVGGAIIRTVRGLPDDKADGFFSGAPSLEQTTADNNLLEKASHNMLDTHPDMFNYQFDGYSGRMVFDRAGSAHFIPQRNFKVIKAQDFSTITIITDSGTKYIFAATEKSRVINNTSLHSAITSDFNSAWFLTSIVSADGTSKIDFAYGAPVTSTKEITSEESYFKTANNGYFEKSTSSVTKFTLQYTTPIVEKISFSNGVINFRTSGRDDLPGTLKLDKIEINYLDGSLFKEFVFNYSYFKYPSSAIQKLRLDNFLEQSGNIKNPPYIFYYYYQAKGVANVAKAIDYWGFFNAEPQTIALPGRLIFVDPNSTKEAIDVDDYALLEGEPMESDLNTTKAFTLWAMSVPTGGITEYEYELNETNYSSESITSIVKSRPIILSTTDTQTKTFTISSNLDNHIGAAAVLTISSTCGIVGEACPEDKPFEIVSGCPLIELTGPISKSWGCQYVNRKYEFYLPKGTYTLKVLGGTGKNFKVELFYFSPKTTTVTRKGPGLRVSKIKTHKLPGDPRPIVKRYLYNDNAGKTTGRLNADIMYEMKSRVVVDKTDKSGELLTGQNLTGCYLKRYFSNGKVSLGVAPSFFVGYSRITELHGENGENGKVEYNYRSTDDFSTDRYGLTVKNWTKGYLEKKTTYRKDNAEYKKVEEITYDYDFNSYPAESKVLGFAIGKNAEIKSECSGFTPPTIPYIPKPSGTSYYRYFPQVDDGWKSVTGKNSFTMFEYALESDWFFLGKSTITNFDYDGKELTKSISYSYDYQNLLQRKRTEETSNSNKKISTLVNYPPHYNDENTFISDLKNNHILNIPIEQVTFSERSTNGENEIKILSAKVSTFQRGDNTNSQYVGRLQTAYSLLVPEGNPISLEQYKFSNTDKGQLPDDSNISNFSIDQNLFSPDFEVEEYDGSTGNATEVASLGNKVKVRWGYNGNFVVCKATNSSVSAYSSFETSAIESGWNYSDAPILQNTNSKAKTGARFYDLASGNISLGSLDPAKKYLISFWSRNGVPTLNGVIGGNGNDGVVDNNGWKYYSRKVANVNSINITSNATNILIDELLLIEAGGLVETYTYDVLKGMTSQSDVNGKVVVYEYDAFGRVTSLRDEKGNITERYEYNLHQ